jgi:hypothetical protein
LPAWNGTGIAVSPALIDTRGVFSLVFRTVDGARVWLTATPATLVWLDKIRSWLVNTWPDRDTSGMRSGGDDAGATRPAGT